MPAGAAASQDQRDSTLDFPGSGRCPVVSGPIRETYRGTDMSPETETATTREQDIAVTATDSTDEADVDVVLIEEVLVEEISIDGMCGVY